MKKKNEELLKKLKGNKNKKKPGKLNFLHNDRKSKQLLKLQNLQLRKKQNKGN